MISLAADLCLTPNCRQIAVHLLALDRLRTLSTNIFTFDSLSTRKSFADLSGPPRECCGLATETLETVAQNSEIREIEKVNFRRGNHLARFVLQHISASVCRWRFSGAGHLDFLLRFHAKRRNAGERPAHRCLCTDIVLAASTILCGPHETHA